MVDLHLYRFLVEHNPRMPAALARMTRSGSTQGTRSRRCASVASSSTTRSRREPWGRFVTFTDRDSNGLVIQATTAHV
jgi:hypothetical protein